jgi:hypothetical protein
LAFTVVGFAILHHRSESTAAMSNLVRFIATLSIVPRIKAE